MPASRAARLAKPPEPKDLVRRLMEPAVKAMVVRSELVMEEIARVAVNQALEQAAKVAERFFVEERADAPPLIRERLQRQNQVAREIAASIRSEMIDDR